MNKIHLNRRQKTVLNLVVGMFLLVFLWVWTGFPILTKGGMIRQAARENLFPSYEVLHEEEGKYRYQYLYLCSEGQFWELRCSGTNGFTTTLYPSVDGICVMPGRREVGDLLALGALGKAETAELELIFPEFTYLYRGAREKDVIRFALPSLEEEQNPTRTALARQLTEMGDFEQEYRYVLRLYDETGTLMQEVNSP